MAGRLKGQGATLTYFVTIAGRRWPVEETFKTGKDVLGWDQSQTRSFDRMCRHTALAALAQLRNIAIRNALTSAITFPPVPCENNTATAPGTRGDTAASDADLVIPLGDAPVPVRGGQPCPRQMRPIRLSVAETARLAALAKQHAAGLIDRSRLASRCAGHGAGGSTRRSPAGTTTAPGSPRSSPDPSRTKGDDAV